MTRTCQGLSVPERQGAPGIQTRAQCPRPDSPRGIEGCVDGFEQVGQPVLRRQAYCLVALALALFLSVWVLLSTGEAAERDGVIARTDDMLQCRIQSRARSYQRPARTRPARAGAHWCLNLVASSEKSSMGRPNQTGFDILWPYIESVEVHKRHASLMRCV